MENSVPITFRVPRTLREVIQNAAITHGLSRSEYICRTLEVHTSNGMSCITSEEFKELQRLHKEVGKILTKQ